MKLVMSVKVLRLLSILKASYGTSCSDLKMFCSDLEIILDCSLTLKVIDAVNLNGILNRSDTI